MRALAGILALLLVDVCFAAAQEIQSPVAAATPEPWTSEGQELFDQHCASCHGAQGDGQGIAAPWLFPRPRNFGQGLFKIKSTPPGALPTDEDLLRTITDGMPGSSMPGFSVLGMPQRRAVLAYVKQLTAYTDDSGKWVSRFKEALDNQQLPTPIEVPPEPPVTAASLAAGSELFTKLACNTCHGDKGAGDGPSAPTLEDSESHWLPARDFAGGIFRGGATGRELFLRVAIGMAGTPMAPFGEGVITPEERWSLVHFVQSLTRARPSSVSETRPSQGSLVAARMDRLPVDPADPFWVRAEPIHLRMQPSGPRSGLGRFMTLRAAHDGKQLALLLCWNQPSAAGSPFKLEDIQAAVTVGWSNSVSAADSARIASWTWRGAWADQVKPGSTDVSIDAAGEGRPVKSKGLWFGDAWQVVFVRDLEARAADKSQIPDRKSQIPDRKSQIPDPRSQIPDRKSQILDLKSQILDLKSQIPDATAQMNGPVLRPGSSGHFTVDLRTQPPSDGLAEHSIPWLELSLAAP